MQSYYPGSFERDMATSEAEWRAALPRAIGPHARWRWDGERQAVIDIPPGQLILRWEPLPERRIALLVIKRLLVRFRFEGVDDEARRSFMRPFDLTLQRGGG